jgi:hypothetical protein
MFCDLNGPIDTSGTAIVRQETISGVTLCYLDCEAFCVLCFGPNFALFLVVTKILGFTILSIATRSNYIPLHVKKFPCTYGTDFHVHEKGALNSKISHTIHY